MFGLLEKCRLFAGSLPFVWNAAMCMLGLEPDWCDAAGSKVGFWTRTEEADILAPGFDGSMEPLFDGRHFRLERQLTV